MKKETRKKMFNVVIVIVTLGMIVTLLAGLRLSGGKSSSNDLVIAEVGKAPVGSVANVNITEKGKTQYKDASKFQIFDGNKQISALSTFDTKITVFPAKKEGDKVDIKLFTKENKQIAVVQVKLKELKK